MLQNIYARYRRHRVRRFIYWSTSVAASLILLFLLVSPLRDFTGEKVNVMLTDVQSVRLDTIQDVQLIIGEKKTIAMAEDADISWTKEDEIEVNGRSSNSTYKSRIDADVTYSTLLVPYGKRSFLTLRDGTKGRRQCFGLFQRRNKREGGERNLPASRSDVSYNEPGTYDYPCKRTSVHYLEGRNLAIYERESGKHCTPVVTLLWSRYTL